MNLRASSKPAAAGKQSTTATVEPSLAQLGFDAGHVANWSGIRQPAKTDLFELLRRMLLNFEKTNVQIRIADTTYNCHMLVLQCYSEFFMELTHEQHVILPADKVTAAAFYRVYEWMLSAEPLVQRDGILELFNAAQYLRIKGLVAQCWVCLDDDERFSEDAAFMLYLEARALGHGDELIQRLMLNRVGKFFLTLVASREFVEFEVDEVCRLLQSNSIAVNAETEVLMAATRWLDWDWPDRQRHLLAVMRCVRFGLMTPWQLVELKRNVDVREIRQFVECAEVQKMVDDALSYVTTKYWYADNADTIQHYLERLQFTEPLERQWIRDPVWYENFEQHNQMCVSYGSFLEYLARIREMGNEHWRSLRFCDGNPHAIGGSTAMSGAAGGSAVGRLAASVWNGVSEVEMLQRCCGERVVMADGMFGKSRPTTGAENDGGVNVVDGVVGNDVDEMAAKRGES